MKLYHTSPPMVLFHGLSSSRLSTKEGSFSTQEKSQELPAVQLRAALQFPLSIIPATTSAPWLHSRQSAFQWHKRNSNCRLSFPFLGSKSDLWHLTPSFSLSGCIKQLAHCFQLRVWQGHRGHTPTLRAEAPQTASTTPLCAQRWKEGCFHRAKHWEQDRSLQLGLFLTHPLPFHLPCHQQ